MGWLDKIGIGALFRGGRLDEAFYENLEETLWAADTGAALATEAVAWLRTTARQEKITLPEMAEARLRTYLAGKLPVADWMNRPPEAGRTRVYVMLGVNGAGKTTTCAKLAASFQKAGVILGACDTFRAAAREQLQVWADRLQVPLVGAPDGSDAAAVAFDTVASALARGLPHCVLDTAGRLHTKDQLLDQLAKLVRAVDKHQDRIERRNLLVLDATQGQAMAAQARVFAEASGVDGLILTKVDTGAKAGTVLGIGASLGLPVTWVTRGEALEDLAVFDPDAYLKAIL